MHSYGNFNILTWKYTFENKYLHSLKQKWCNSYENPLCTCSSFRRYFKKEAFFIMRQRTPPCACLLNEGETFNEPWRLFFFEKFTFLSFYYFSFPFLMERGWAFEVTLGYVKGFNGIIPIENFPGDFKGFSSC